MLIFDNVLANYISNNWCSKPVCETNPPKNQNLIVNLITGGQWLCFSTQWSVPGRAGWWLPLWIKLFSNVIKNMECQLQVKLSIGKSAEASNTWESNTLSAASSFLGVPSPLKLDEWGASFGRRFTSKPVFSPQCIISSLQSHRCAEEDNTWQPWIKPRLQLCQCLRWAEHPWQVP